VAEMIFFKPETLLRPGRSHLLSSHLAGNNLQLHGKRVASYTRGKYQHRTSTVSHYSYQRVEDYNVVHASALYEILEEIVGLRLLGF
jgi:hypothetical protein